MKKNLKLVLFLIFLAFACPPYAQSAKVITVKDDPVFKIEGGTIIDIALKIDAPFSTAVLTIQFYDGAILYRAQQHGQAEILDSGTLTQSRMSALAKLLEDTHFLEMKNHPQNADDPLDGSTYTITIRVLPPGADPALAFAGGHPVSCYQFSCEDNFLRVKDKMIELWGKNILETGV